MVITTLSSRAGRIAGRSAVAAVCVTAMTVAAVASPAFASSAASSIMAGYAADPGSGLASASATFTVPTLNCSGGGFVTQFMGVADPTTFETSTSTVLAGIYLGCSGTTPFYDYDDYVNGTLNLQTGANPGDRVVTSMYQTASSEGAEIHDLTNGQTWSDVTSPVPTTTIGVGLFANGIGNPIAPFAKTTFSKVQINGDYLSFESPTEYKLTSGATTLVKTSAIASRGDSFTVKFEAS